ncbi:MAG: cytochrome c [Desulfobacteraceae bacterium]|nr:cytochrome c [Desulfobacteraceae bacterium]MBC2752060.1 cytochrome c [Desulfobacteraceae bacterium]
MKTLAQAMVMVVVGTLIAGGALAQFAKPEDAIKYRKSVMVLIAQHFKSMGAVVQGKAEYDQQAFVANAEVVKMLATLPWEASLEPGSDKGDTTLSPAVFDKREDFEKTARSFETATAKLAETAKGSDFDAVKAQFGEVAKSCKGCHKPFRK